VRNGDSTGSRAIGGAATGTSPAFPLIDEGWARSRADLLGTRTQNPSAARRWLQLQGTPRVRVKQGVGLRPGR
jgi:hypothetical protein